MTNRFDIKDIIRFSEGEMEAKERLDFEQALQTDQNLKNDYDLYNQVNGTLRAKFNTQPADIEFKQKLKEFNTKYFTKGREVPVRKLKTNRFFYAAAVILLALFIWAPWNQNLYNKYSGTQMVSVAERGTANETLLSEATQAFNSKDFYTAKSKLKSLLESDTNNDMLKFYYGISLLETNEILNSRTHLDAVFNGESVFKDEAAFYMALSYVKEKNNNAAKAWLEKVSSDSAVFEKAQELKARL